MQNVSSCDVLTYNLDVKGFHRAIVVHVSKYVRDSCAYNDSSSC